MLVLARKVGQSIVINENIELLVIEVRGDQVRLGIDAPKSIPVHRKELLEQIRAENVKAASDLDVETVSKAIGDVSKA
jgi:carbon storage regulator